MLPPKELVLFKNGNAEKCRKMPKNAEKCRKYVCANCNFICSKLSNYNTHLLTAKHQMITNGNKW